MKKTAILLFISLIFILPQTLKASHFMGGEITWKCINSGSDAGKYIFYLKVYRECGGIDFGNNQILNSNSPTSSYIPLELVNDYPIDISPVCNSAFPQITCAGAEATGADNTGAISEYLYESAPIQLNGIPPSIGWTFSWSLSARNSSDNIVGQQNWNLRAKMYPYNNTDASTCLDNSPQFTNKAKAVLTSGNPFSYTHAAYDSDFDSLSFEWGVPMVSSGIPITYQQGYSFSNPLPDSSINTNNIGASIEPNTGLISFLSYTTGSFLTCVKISSYRDNQLIAEVWREIQLTILSGNTNTHPILGSLNSGGNNTLTDTVTAGETHSFFINGEDIQFLPNGAPQTIYIKANGQQFGNYMANTLPHPTLDSLNGCPNIPCATLTPAPSDAIPTSGVSNIQTKFNWTTNCSHLKTKPDGSLAPRTYYFNFSIYDDFCPVPAENNFTYSLTVIPNSDSITNTLSTEIKSINILQNGDINIKWSPVIDTSNLFIAYSLYQSASINGPFVLIDSITNPNIGSYTIRSSSSSTVKYYKIKTYRTNCANTIGFSASEIFKNIVLNASNINNCINKLTWNNTDSTNSYYIIKRKHNNIWSVIDSTISLTYTDTSSSPNVDYMIETSSILIYDSLGNTSYIKSNSNTKHIETSINIGIDTTICNSSSLLLQMNSAFDTYQWYNGETNNWILINASNFTIGDHDIWLKANMNYGCEVIDSLVLTIEDCTSLSENNIDNLSFDIFPNPCSGKFTLDINTIDTKDLLIEVISIDGEIIFSKKIKITELENIINMDISGNSAGSYIIRISNEDYKKQKAINLL